MDTNAHRGEKRDPWNKRRLIGQKLPLKLKEIWEIRTRLQLAKRLRDLALFNLAIDSKLCGCDLVTLRVKDVSPGRSLFYRAIVIQQKGLSSSKSPSRLVSQYLIGSITASSLRASICFPVE